MTPWLTLSLGLWLGQAPEITPTLPPDDTQDPAAIELREAWEDALEQADATDEGEERLDESVQMPVLEIGTRDSPISVPVENEAAQGGAAAQEAPGIGGAGLDTAQEGTGTQGVPSAPAPAPSGQPRGELERLRSQIQALQTQLEAQQAESSARAAAVQEQLSGMQERAEEQERLRTQRLQLLEDAGLWLLASDQSLVVGELDVGDSLTAVDTALVEVIQNASDAGQGQTVQLVEFARDRVAFALDAVGRRDSYFARQALYEANLALREARRQALDRPDTSIVTQ